MQDAPPGCAASCRQFLAAGNANKPGRAPLPSAVPSSSTLPRGHLVPARGQAGHPPCPRWHRRTGSNGDSWTWAGAVPARCSCPGHPAAVGWDRAQHRTQDPSPAPAPGAGFSADTERPFPTRSKASFQGSPFFHPTFSPPRSCSMGLGACRIFSLQHPAPTPGAVWASRYPWVWWLPWLLEHLCGPEPPKTGFGWMQTAPNAPSTPHPAPWRCPPPGAAVTQPQRRVGWCCRIFPAEPLPPPSNTGRVSGLSAELERTELPSPSITSWPRAWTHPRTLPKCRSAIKQLLAQAAGGRAPAVPQSLSSSFPGSWDPPWP